MRRLILLRHGKAEIAGLTGGDRERPLADRGKADAARTAQWMQAQGYVPDLVLLSPAARTRATWECLRPVFPGARVEAREALYLATAEMITDILDTAPVDAKAILVVGHNPGLQELGLRVATEARAPEVQSNRIGDGFPTATAVVFGFDDAGAATLEAIYEPPRAAGEAPRWVFSSQSPGDPD